MPFSFHRRPTLADVRGARHFLRRYYVIHQRVQEGALEIGHIPDKENPSDFLTKWVTKKKFLDSVNYLTNHKALPINAVPGDPG